MLVPFNSRFKKSDIDDFLYKTISKGKYLNKWYNETMLKDPLTMGMYSLIINDKKFKTIFELGSYNGASAHWLYTLLSHVDLDGSQHSVHSFDIDFPFCIHDKFMSCSKLSKTSSLSLNYHFLNANDLIDTNKKKQKEVLYALKKKKKLIEITANCWIHANTLKIAKNILKEHFIKKDEIAISEFKKMTSTSRKYAIPLLEFLDRIQLTERKGNNRTKGVNFEK